MPAKLAERINAIAIERARSVTSLPGEGVVSQGTIKPPGAPTTQGKGKITTG